ncbi:hypothetical protein SCOR_28660 [Sulfidibacter corallicola]
MGALWFLLAAGGVARPGEWSGQATLENFGFAQNGQSERQESHVVSFTVQPEYYVEWDGGRQSFTFEPFWRYDHEDSERSHLDIRELTWLKAADRWELRLGVRKVFWGVAESVHLVDIINQTDLVENLDGEEKLGQPMINFAWIESWGTAEIFLLTGFRERSFPGHDGRLRTPIIVDDDLARYESGAEEERLDWALRYGHTVGAWDFGASYFSGTSREPLLQPDRNAAGETVLAPFYPVIDQLGLDVQGTFGSWLLKWESTYRRDFGDRDFLAAVGGFEYTFFDLRGTGIDIGLLGEYLYDERGEDATNPFDDDVFVGTRLALNDTWSTELLAGVVIDGSGGGNFVNVEGQRRITDHLTLSLEYRAFTGTEAEDPLHAFRDDDHFRLEAGWYW